MRKTLHILTRPEDAIAEDIIAKQEASETSPEIRRFDLTSKAPDYEQLLTEIFEADSVQVW
jgi:hypothetical protein